VNLFSPLDSETRRLLDRLPGVINKTFPLPQRFRLDLRHDVADLSRLLTSSRSSRGASYLGKPRLLSAYLRYFLPWNVYRLCRLLPSLPLTLAEGDAVTDLGAGPCTLAIALWISRPDLRKLGLEFRCLDMTAPGLEAGKKLLAALLSEEVSSGRGWTIRTVKTELRGNGTLSAPLHGKPAALAAAVNFFNEVFWDLSPANTQGLKQAAERNARLLASLAGERGAIFVMEPGIPRSGEFISALRDALMEKGRFPLSPCVHAGPCPFPGGFSPGGGKVKWCHFGFDTEDAPAELHRLSAAAGIPKERAVLSFLLAGGPASTGDVTKNDTTPVRIISDSFPVGKIRLPEEKEGRRGRYGCSAKGSVLAVGSGKTAEEIKTGSLIRLALAGNRDPKSGALTGEIPADTGSTEKRRDR
jgi:hypothetical protein